MSEIDQASARMSEAVRRTQTLTIERLVAWNNACADALNAIADAIEDEAVVPNIGEIVAKAIADANVKPQRALVCALCLRKIGDEPMVCTRSDPTPRFVHYPVCPSEDLPPLPPPLIREGQLS